MAPPPNFRKQEESPAQRSGDRANIKQMGQREIETIVQVMENLDLIQDAAQGLLDIAAEERAALGALIEQIKERSGLVC